MGAMGIDRLGANAQVAADMGIAVALGHQSQYITFTLSEFAMEGRQQPIPSPIQVGIYEFGVIRPVHDDFTMSYHPHRPYQVGGPAVFLQVPSAARSHPSHHNPPVLLPT